MARPQGAQTQLALAWESTFGTAPVSGYNYIPFASTTLGTDQPLLENELMGTGRDPSAPMADATVTDGEVVIPVDAVSIGHWLKGLLGGPATTGAGADKTHTFTSGAGALPSLSIEKQISQLPRFEMFSGVMVDTLSLSMQRKGLLQATVGLIGQKQVSGTSTAAGTPAASALTRFGHFNGTIKRDGSALGSIIKADIKLANNLDVVDAIRADGLIEALDPGMAAATGTLTARLADDTLLGLAEAGTAMALEFAWTISATVSLSLTLHSVRLARSRVPISGPGGLQVDFAFTAAKAASPARMATAVLKNQVASY